MTYYSETDVVTSLKRLNLKKGDVVYVSGNLSNLGLIKSTNYKNIPKVFYQSLTKIIGKNGTIIVPTFTFYLVNSNKIFTKKTFSDSGAFSNFILKKKYCIRSTHPYSSFAAIGKFARFICNNKTKSVYGKGSPMEKIIKLDAKFISIGKSINLTCAQVHHAEKIKNVPYRYDKKFKHSVIHNKKVSEKNFYMYVIKKKFLNFKRNKNKNIINYFLKKKEKLYKIKLGKNFLYKYDIKAFYLRNIELLNKDIYCWYKNNSKNKI